MLLAIVASMWAAVITIPLIVRWRDSRHIESVGNFSRSLGVLGHQCSTSMTAIPGRQSVRRSSWTILTKFGRVEPQEVLHQLYGSSVQQSGRAVRNRAVRVSRLARQKMIRRRKNVLLSLFGSTTFFFVVNILHSSRITELLTLLAFLALISYVGLLVQFKKAAFN